MYSPTHPLIQTRKHKHTHTCNTANIQPIIQTCSHLHRRSIPFAQHHQTTNHINICTHTHTYRKSPKHPLTQSHKQTNKHRYNRQWRSHNHDIEHTVVVRDAESDRQTVRHSVRHTRKHVQTNSTTLNSYTTQYLPPSPLHPHTYTDTCVHMHILITLNMWFRKQLYQT